MMNDTGLRQRFPIDVHVKKAPSLSGSDSGSETELYDSDVDLPVYKVPNYTIKDLLGAIPKHCFERSALKSTSYVVGDFLMIAAVMYAASYIDPSFGKSGNVLRGNLGIAAKWAAWSAYWVMAGFNFTGVWILAHECGHQAFSSSKQFNNAMGLFLHSLVLVPYHSWRISHSKHHAATGHMTRDEVFVPPTRSTMIARAGKQGTPAKVQHHNIELEELLEDAPAYRLYKLVLQQLFGWPAYLIINATGPAIYPKWTNHFDPNSLLFDARHRRDILMSDAGLLVVLAGLTWVAKTFGFGALVKYYGIPYLMTNHWLVMITFLQHTDPNLPHYRAGEWNFARGALCTIDRNLLGPVGPYLLHGICETHVSHHIHSKIPHYNAWEATEALKNFLGDHYLYTDEPMFVSLWKNYKSCRFVDDTAEVVMYRDAYGRAQARAELESPISDSGVEVN